MGIGSIVSHHRNEELIECLKNTVILKKSHGFKWNRDNDHMVFCLCFQSSNMACVRSVFPGSIEAPDVMWRSIEILSTCYGIGAPLVCGDRIRTHPTFLEHPYYSF